MVTAVICVIEKQCTSSSKNVQNGRFVNRMGLRSLVVRATPSKYATADRERRRANEEIFLRFVDTISRKFPTWYTMNDPLKVLKRIQGSKPLHPSTSSKGPSRVKITIDVDAEPSLMDPKKRYAALNRTRSHLPKHTAPCSAQANQHKHDHVKLITVSLFDGTAFVARARPQFSCRTERGHHKQKRAVVIRRTRARATKSCFCQNMTPRWVGSEPFSLTGCVHEAQSTACDGRSTIDFDYVLTQPQCKTDSRYCILQRSIRNIMF